MTSSSCSSTRIDYDSLLLGGCWCHQCLPVNPCRHGGVCVNYQKQGDTCDCAATISFDEELPILANQAGVQKVCPRATNEDYRQASQVLKEAKEHSAAYPDTFSRQADKLTGG